MSGNQAQQQANQQTQQTQSTDDPNKPFNYRQLEESRDKAVDRANKWRDMAIDRTLSQQGFDPKQGVGSLLRDAFVREHEDLDPEKLDDTFNEYISERGITPTTATGEGGGGDGGGEGGGRGTDTNADQLIEGRQRQAQDLANSAQPPQGGSKTIQQQIQEAQANGDQEAVNKLNSQWAVQQMAEAQKAG